MDTNKEIDEILKEFNGDHYATEEEIKNMDFYELALYAQLLNKTELIYNDIASLKENENGTSINS